MRIVPLIALVGLALASCTSSNANDSACTAFANAQCVRLEACAPFAVTYTYGSVATCEARKKAACLAGADAPDDGYTNADRQSCATAVTAETCTDYLAGVVPTACDNVAGKRTNGTSCGFSSQCQSTYCAIAANAQCGTCADRPTAGTSCVTFDCGNQGLLCANNGVCVTPAAGGAPCDSEAQPCQASFSCVHGLGVTAGTCMAKGAAGGTACDNATRTAANCNNELGFFCSKGLCTQLATATGTAACGPTATDQYTVCVNGGACANATTAATGTCQPPAADGAACDIVNGPPCLEPARCVFTTSDAGVGGPSGTCQLAAPNAC